MRGAERSGDGNIRGERRSNATHLTPTAHPSNIIEHRRTAALSPGIAM